jgi:ribosome-interacting GTPase 1
VSHRAPPREAQATVPTNVTPEYKKAETAFRKAREPAERLQWLNEMLRLIPKHKGTEHLQADIKTRIKELTAELRGPQKGAARTGPVHTVRREGSAQIALIGPPNSGKSLLHKRLTGSKAEVGAYPYTTTAPLPGMLLYKDVQFQLVDLPPVSVAFMESWLPNALQPADAALLVVDLHVPGCVEDVAAICEQLEAKRITLTDDWSGRLAPGLICEPPGTAGAATAPADDDTAADDDDGAAVATSTDSTVAGGDENAEQEALEDPFRVLLPTLLIVGKCDAGVEPEEIDLLEELVGLRFPALCVSAEKDQGIDHIGEALLRGLGIVRIYTKTPGKEADTDRPYTVFRGDTIADVASLIHRELAASVKFARVWGSTKFDGQQVGRDYLVQDGDIVELHS